MKPLVIYHHPCTDGWTAAWAVAKAHGGPDHVDLHPANYGDAPPDVRGRDVIVVDFSFSRETLLAMAEVADSILVLDHHKTAREALDGLSFAEFDMERSGAGMAWDYFHPESPRSVLVDYVEDRDIWRKSLPHTEEVTAAIGLWDIGDYAVWETLNTMMNGPGIRELMAEGRAVLRARQQMVKASLERAGFVSLDGRDEVVPCVVCEPLLRSDVGHALLGESHHYSVTFRESENGFTYSLRSDDSRMDVSAIAREFGGGGHRNAAGVHTERPIHTWVQGL